jgi:hypothetical protein
LLVEHIVLINRLVASGRTIKPTGDRTEILGEGHDFENERLGCAIKKRGKVLDVRGLFFR